VASLVAVVAASQVASGHTFSSARTIVVQVERCELAVLVGYQPGTGEASDALLARVGSAPRSRIVETARAMLTSQAMGALTVAADARPLEPTSVRAKLALDPRGTRPQVLVLVTFALPPAARQLTVATRDPRATRISWSDHDSGRVDPGRAPAQGRWYPGVASFLLTLLPSRGDSACARSTP
jgi:hypothetical protein